jgi:hypothetical protein
MHPTEWRESCKKRKKMVGIKTALQATDRTRPVMKTPPEEKKLEGVWEEAVAKAEGMEQGAAAVVAEAAKAGAGNDPSCFSFSVFF